MSFSEHNVFHPATTSRTDIRPSFANADLRKLYECRAIDRAVMQSAKTLAPSFSDQLRRFEETLEANLVIFVGKV